MKPSAYKHIAAWCRLHGRSPHETHLTQRRAAYANAPVDAVYWSIWNGGWVTMAEVGVQTRMSVEVQLNKRGKKP